MFIYDKKLQYPVKEVQSPNHLTAREFSSYEFFSGKLGAFLQKTWREDPYVEKL